MPLLLGVLLMFSFLSSTLVLGIEEMRRTNEELQDEEKAAVVAVLATAVNSFYQQTRRYPADLDELQAAPGYEYVAAYRLPLVGYARTGVMADLQWSYSRAAVFAQRKRDEIDSADYLLAANNSCGGTDFAVAGSWCGAPLSYWWKAESRQHLPRQLAETRRNLNRTLQLLVNRFSAGTGLPRGGLGDGDSAPLADLVGYAGDAGNCAGTFDFEGVPLNCDDLFAPQNGNRVIYTFVDSARIAVTVESGVVDETGTQIVITQDIEIATS